jgi:NADH-quinone oxidoreductase subunit G
MIRQNGKLRPASWNEALSLVADRIRAANPQRLGVIAGELQDAESMKAALDLFGALGAPSIDCRTDGSPLGAGPRESWLFNSTIEGLERADAVLLVGANPRMEAAVLNARLRKMWLSGRTRFGLVGRPVDLTFDYDHLGAGGEALGRLTGSDHDFVKAFKAAQRPAVIVGAGALARDDGAAVLAAAARAAGALNVVRDGWNGWNVLHTAASRVGGLDLGFVPRAGGLTATQMMAPGVLDVLFLMGVDEMDLGKTDAFVVYMGTHGDRGAHRADVILPGAAYTEKDGVYVNTEGRVQRGERATFPKGEAKEDWAILRALSGRLGSPLPYDTLDQLREKLFGEHPTFGQIDYAPGSVAAPLDLSGLGEAGEIAEADFLSPIRAYHLTNPICRASVTMAECAALAAGLKIAAE